ncbi:hypothetical protein Pint_26429 [Pistacia integerrima]|uniref:Uncharacterized protein n=1 Tax=Pistacia integerrima TaxID=434235 RepID=A0ACC0YH54_9ROSI|nr:hypothetical protein Pint_26429 [Pistacia integerrima]
MQLISWVESTKWVLPALASFLLQLPSLLEIHYQNADDFLGKYGIQRRLSILGPQEVGIVFPSQELIVALLPCSFFCLFHLPTINFHELFIPSSFIPLYILEAYVWSKSIVPLCPFEAYSLGSIKDHPTNGLQVDFANKYIGGGALHRGCVQDSPGIVTGNWGCGALGEDPVLKAIIQWLGASRCSPAIAISRLHIPLIITTNSWCHSDTMRLQVFEAMI